ncbi:MAG: hypothetical protein ACRDJM_05560 [Actinomycetota bacterium]
MARQPIDLVEARRWGAGTAGIIRLLIAADSPLTQRAIAAATSLSQPRVSQVVGLLSSLGGVRVTVRGYIGRRSRLLDLYTARTKPPLAESERCFYSTRPLREQARGIVKAARRRRTTIAFSADLGPDLLVPWRHPTLAIVYAMDSFPMEEGGFVEAEGRGDASIILRTLTDATLLIPAKPWPSAVDGIPLTDPVQQWWDLLDLDGQDRVEAAGRLRRAILNRSIASS